MRIAFAHWGKSGAGPQILVQLALSAAHDHHVWVCVSDAVAPQVQRQLLGASERVDSLRTYATIQGALLGVFRAGRFSWAYTRRLRAAGVDCVVSSMESLWQPLLALACKARRIPYVASIHDVTHHTGERSRVATVMRSLELWAADVVLVYSENALSEFARVYPRYSDRAVGIDHGPLVPIRTTARNGPTRRPVVGFVGRLQPYKGLENLAQIADRVRAASPDVDFEVWGEGDDDVVKAIDAGSRVAVHRGYIDDADLAGVVDRFDVMLLPYSEATQSGVVTLALARGLPCVVTPVGALREQICDDQGALAGVVVGDTSPKAIADGVIDVLSSKPEYRTMSGRAIEISRSRGWDRALRRIAGALSGA